jgi:AhpD family alkylhydroperoxidase
MKTPEDTTREDEMESRIDVARHLGSALTRAMLDLQRQVDASGLEHSLLELMKIRASQINGCAYCLDMHTKDARAMGESEQRMYALSAWHETPFFTPRERAALEWTEAVTLLSVTHVPDDVYERVRGEFAEEEIVALTFAVVVINGWNRLAVSFRTVPGTYQPRQRPEAVAAS